LTLGEFADLDETLRRIDAVSAASVQELAEELVTRPLSTAAVGPVAPAAFAGIGDQPVAA
ncbi:MAG TPA: insulinase family protein, partial [Protaetiibacter sp.]|nr:insulinase family protein [Protaetiibacter sp.]